MTLEDFFTLTEMKNGLTTCARVEELICVMQKLNCVTNNVGDAARQWSTAASTLASTQNRECLRLFVHLNGLGFLNHWLQEAVQCSRDVADGDELINTLIVSLDKLPVNPEKLSSSGIFTTVEKLFGHTNVNIKERARMLFNKWNNKSADDDSCKEMEKDSSYPVGDYKPSVNPPSIEFNHAAEEVAENSSVQTGDEGTRKVDSGGIQNVCDDDHRLGDAEDLKCSAPDRTLPGFSSIENEYQALSPPTATVSDAVEENCSVQEGNFIPEIQAKVDDLCKTSERRDVEAEPNKVQADMWKLREPSGVLSSSGLSATSHTKTSKVFRSVSCNLTLDEGRKPMLLDDKEALHRCVSVDGMWLENSKTMKEVNSAEEDSSYNLENTGDVDHCDEPTLNSCGGVDAFIHDDPPKTSNGQATRETKKGSDSEPESGEMDALEIARLVAIEVEREVVDYREELCSSSSEVSSNEAMSTASPSIERGEQGHSMLGEAIESESIHMKDGCAAISDPKDPTDLLIQEQNLETLNRAEIGKFDFDLNEDACAEDFDSAVNHNHPNKLIINLPAPIAVSASKGAPVFLIAPLCFDAGLGWKGSAATSAFRPASPRRASDGEKSESGSKFRPNLIELDLNLTGTEDHLPADAASIREVPVSSSMPSRNSSSEVSSLKAERIKFDLNSNGDGEATTPLIKHHFLNDGRSSSPASSSSLRQQPRKNFDLNHNLFSSDTAISKSVSLSMAANPHGIKTDDSVIAIMGSRMPVEQRPHANQTHQSYFGNGFSSVVPYPHQIPHPAYGYIPPGATGMALPFQPPVYGFGSIPHMIDSRGATVVPQLLSSVGANGTATPPFLMSITNTPSSSNARPSPPGLDLNFGLMQMETEAEAAETMGNAKLPLMPGRVMEEQINNSGNSLKRKETESGWESYSYGFKHLASWN